MSHLILRGKRLGGQAAITGHSMGGHGALTLGLKNPDLYKAISAFAPIVNPITVPWGQKAFTGYLGEDKESWKQYDACQLAQVDNSLAQWDGSPFPVTSSRAMRSVSCLKSGKRSADTGEAMRVQITTERRRRDLIIFHSFAMHEKLKVFVSME